VTIATPRRISGLVLAAVFAAGACSSAATPAAPASAAPSAAASSGATAAPSAAASSGATAAPSAAAAPTVPSGDVTLAGAGATFPTPLYQVWIEQFAGKYPNVKLDYQSIGSGGGIKNITAQTVDFGASDAAMKDEEIAALPAGTKLLHIPTALGAVVFIYNLPGVTDLNLDGPTAADIFLGNIKTWNDPKIAALNSGATLPSTAIVVAHRSDGSGTTNAFTSYLGAVSDAWKSGPGVGKEVNWPTGIGAKGNDGVAGSVKQTPGAIGYVELNYATQAGLATAKLKNADGKFVAGSVAGVTAAADAAAADFPADFRAQPIINGAGPDTYPIAAYTYLLVYQDQKDANKGQALIAFVDWALTDGQALENDLGYAPLPAAIAARAIDALHGITTGGAAIWPRS
jgi:phosphate transport system substrate-binding protein